MRSIPPRLTRRMVPAVDLLEYNHPTIADGTVVKIVVCGCEFGAADCHYTCEHYELLMRSRRAKAKPRDEEYAGNCSAP